MGSSQEQNAPSAIQLPIIDITNPTTTVGAQMLKAAREFGFLYIDPKGTAFTEDLVNRQFELSRQLFSLPDSDKEKCRINRSNRGWTGMGGETLDPRTQRRGDLKEAFNMGEFINGRPEQPLPDLLERNIELLSEFEASCRKVAAQILDLLGLGLQIEDGQFFSSRHTQPSGCIFRLLHYPLLAQDSDYDPDVDIRAGAHSDYGSVTLLFQRPSQPGLEIRTSDDTWAPVPVFPEGYESSTTLPPILVNIGDLLSYWTNGLLKSTVHRVVFPKDSQRAGEDRYSIAYFCHPADQVELIPVPSRIVAEHVPDQNAEIGYGGGTPSQRALTAQQHLFTRLEATYGFREGASAV
ncbi:hypothetical protein B0A52_10214 [Exophiala mesophila]|uniref:Fe2OG dioxygenase domain-containing protein n=1 Tax=Exophiala mesophila TaxID=212818 RepID=A0A438MS17_EXOME|nr:hypothetical protein B0A52_10214 [Exophiala mesophila]